MNEAHEGRSAKQAENEWPNLSNENLLSNLSHELRTPLNGILGVIGLLLESGLTKRQEELATIAMGSSHQLLKTITEILEYLHLQEDEGIPQLVNFQVRALVGDAVNPFRMFCDSKEIQLLVDIDSDVPDRAFGDSARLGRILTCLIDNACKFTKEGSVRVSVRVAENVEFQALRFDVTDTGIGLTPDHQRQLFAPFTQADMSSTRQYGGVGLGLASARRLTSLTGGSLQVSSELGVGSKFWFTNPYRFARASRQMDSVELSEVTVDTFPVADVASLPGWTRTL